jgi:hypothetical protein
MKKLLLFLLLLMLPIAVFSQATGKHISNKASGGSITSDTINAFSNFNLYQTSAGQTITIGSPTNPKLIYLRNIGSVPVTISPGGLLPVGKTAIMGWTGASWSTSLRDADGTYLPLSGGTMTGSINTGGNNITNVDIVSTILGGQIGNSNGTTSLSFQDGGVLSVVGTPRFFSGGSHAANTVPIINGSKDLVSSSVTSTELGYLSGVTSNIQDQIDAGGGGGGTWGSITGTLSDQTDLQDELDDKIGLGDLSAGSPLIYNNGTGAFSLPVATGLQHGYLSSTDWTLFNRKLKTLPTLGTIINENWASASAWTEVDPGSTGTFTVGSNKLTAVNSTNSFTAYLKNTAYGITNLDHTVFLFTIDVGTINSTSIGSAFGIGGNSGTRISAGIRLNTLNKGIIYFYLNESLTPFDSSTTALEITSGDVINVAVRRIKNVFIYSAYNVNTSTSITHSCEIDINGSTFNSQNISLPIGGYYCIYALGGTSTIRALTISSDNFVGSDLLIVGTSISTGSKFVGLSGRFVDKIQEQTNAIIEVNAGPGNTIANLNVPEILSLGSGSILLEIGANEKLAGMSDATLKSKIDSIYALLTGYTTGINFFILELLPNNSFSNTGINALLRATYGSGCINANSKFYTAGGTGFSYLYTPDGTHPNESAANLIANAVIARIGFTILPRRNFNRPNYSAVLKSRNGYIAAGYNNLAPNFAFDASDTSGTCIRFGQSPNAINGGFLGSTGPARGFFSSGKYFSQSSGLYVATSTVSSGIAHFDGKLIISNERGNTIGSTINNHPTVIIDTMSVNIGDRGTSGSTDAPLIIERSSNSNLLSQGLPGLSIRNVNAAQGNGSSTYNRAQLNLRSGNGSITSSYTTAYESGGTFANSAYIGTTSNHNFYLISFGNIVSTFNSTGVGIGTTSPTARLHLAAGTATANTAPIKLTSGINLTTPEAGAVEFDGANYFVTSSTTRFTLAKTLTNTATLNYSSIAAGGNETLTITVTGAAVGDAVTVGIPNGSKTAGLIFGTPWVSSTNTVSIEAYNSTGSPIDPASGTFRVSVIKY